MSGRTLARRVAKAGAGALPPGAFAAVFGRLAPRVGIGGAEHGLLTLVVVTEEVDAPRLDDTLASIGEQTHGYREVLLAPVGDAARRLATEARRGRGDPRVRVLDAAPTWQQAATAGARHARGRYLFLHRACDPVPWAGLPALVASLSASGADLAIGTTAQRGQPDEWLLRAQERAHAHPATGLVPASFPELAGDLAVGNRVVRTDVWRSAGLALDEHDDWLVSPTMARLLRRARSVDVLTTPVTEHLAEHGNRAFGAMPSSLPELAGWRTRAEQVEQALAGSPLLDGWLEHCLDVAVPRFLKDAERTDGEEWAALRHLVETYAARAGEPAPATVRVESRALLWLAGADRRGQLAALAAETRDLGADLPTVLVEGRVLADWRSLADDVPDDVRTLAEAETPLVAEVRRLRDGETDLVVRVVHVDLAAADPTVTVRLPDGTVLDSHARPDPEATRWAGTRFQAALSVRVGLPAGATSLQVQVRAAGLDRQAVVPLLDPVTRDPDADPTVTVTDLGLEGGELVLAVRGEGVRLRLVDDGDRVVGHPRVDGDRLRFDLRHEAFGRACWLPSGRYRLTTPRGNPTLADGLAGRLPVEQVGERHRLRAHVGAFGGLVVPLGAPLTDDEQGPHAQQRLVESYAAHPGPVDRDVVYFESYAGRSATDSPLAVLTGLRERRPDLALWWGVADHAQWVPDGVTPVLLRSRAWYDLLATAGCLVLNTDVEPWFRRREGQVLLQTFHGYPSKGMGQVQWRAKHYPPSRVAEMRARGVDTWSAIVTPTPQMTRHYREQYGYGGPAFERGYPRDDDLTAPDAGERRARTRALLGIRDDQTAVLYAPTWRDHLATRPRGADMDDLLDVGAAAGALGDSHVLLLRGHRFHSPEPVPGVVDVTSHPEVNDLILAADVAVLDYSSLRFDFALTGKPMVFLVPDLADYGAGTRSFLFPFEDSAPGPLVEDTRAVVREVRDVVALRARWAGEIEAFNATFHPYQDGHATERVVDGLLAMLGDVGTPG